MIGKAIVTMLKTRMRQEELLALSWNDIDFEKEKISIHQALSLKDYKPYIKETTKTPTSTRTIPMHSVVKQILLDMSKTADKSKTVFCNSTGGLWDTHVFYRQYVRFFEALNRGKPETEKVEYRSPHACRHTFATDLNRAGVDPKPMAELLGHSRADISIDVYSHSDDQLKRSSISKI